MSIYLWLRNYAESFDTFASLLLDWHLAPRIGKLRLFSQGLETSRQSVSSQSHLYFQYMYVFALLLATKVLFCLTSKLLSVLPPKPFVVGTCSTLISLRVVFLLYATVATASVVVHNQIMIYALKGRETWPLEPLRCIQGTETYLFSM